MISRGEFDERRRRRRSGSGKTTRSVYGDRIVEGSSSLNKPHDIDNSEVTRELHKVKRVIGRYKETSDEADFVKSQAESELRNAMNAARDLSSLLIESSSNTMAQRQEIETLRISREPGFSGSGNEERYEQVMRELENVKQELQMLKLDMASVLAEKSRAVERTDAARAKVASCSSSIEEAKRQIEESNDELVLVELARIEALRERAEIEAERAKEAVRFSHTIDQTRRRRKDVVDEIEASRELEPKLASTLADIDVLKHELRQAKTEKRVSLESLTEALEAAKRELATVKEEGFQCMASMDIIRNELKRTKIETARLEESEKNHNSALGSLNVKLVRAKAKLESASAAEERANSIVSNLSTTLGQLKKEAEAAKREQVAVAQEVSNIKAEIRKAESETDLTEEKLEMAMKTLEEAKAREDSALEKLKARIERTVETRTRALKQSSSITISRFEYEYLSGRAVGADDLADKKVLAAKAWVEAIRANEKEIAIKVDFVAREMREMRIEEEREAYKMERSFSAKRTVERELQSWKPRREKANADPEAGFKLGTHKRSVRENGTSTPSRRPKFRVSGSPAGVHRNSFPMKKKRQVLPNIVNIFKGGKAAEKSGV